MILKFLALAVPDILGNKASKIGDMTWPRPFHGQFCQP